MLTRPRAFRPATEFLEGRMPLAAGLGAHAAHVAAETARAGDLNGDGRVDFADESLFQAAYLTRPGDPAYNPAADLNHNGTIGMVDGKLLLRDLTISTPRIPLKVDLALARGEYAFGTGKHNSGGITRRLNVTVVGRTTPGSLVFSDTSLGNYTFAGPVAAADARGHFSFNYTLDPDGPLLNTEYLTIDPSGRQKIRAFPILLVR